MAEKICLIDGSGYIFRAFYGLPPLTAPDGTPVNAVYGFTNMFMKLTQKIGCDYNLVLFDAKRHNFRNEIFADYKANRKETPEELVPQFPIIREAVDALNLNFFEKEGYEADDLIATYTRLALSQGMEVIIVSADKDLMQLIRDGVSFYDPMKDKFFTPEDVKEKFGVYPQQVIDVQALSGDSSDNIPGIPGIGPKTAAELVNQFGSLSEVLANAETIKQQKRRETIMANIESAQISLRLVTLDDNVEVPKNPNDYPCRCPKMEVMEEFIAKYGFNSLKPRVIKWVEEQCGKANPTAAPKVEIKKHFEIIDSEEKLKKYCEAIKKQAKFVIKIFTTGNNPTFDEPVGIGIGLDNNQSAYIPLISGKESGKTLDLFATAVNQNQIALSQETIAKYLCPIMEANSILKIGYDIKQDMHFIGKLFGNHIKVAPYDDIKVISYVLDSSEHYHDLHELSDLFLDYKMQDSDAIFGVGKNKISAKAIELVSASDYICEQTYVIYRLYKILRPRLLNEHMVTIYEHYDRPLIATLLEMERNGIEINAKELGTFSLELDQLQKALEKDIYQIVGQEFNLSSPKQIGEILYNKLGLKGKKNAKGAFQTGADVLEQMAESHPLPQKILDWRMVAKLKSTYTDALLMQLDANNRIHTTYEQTIVNTGRLSSTNPNLQNIPIRSEEGLRIRRCFVAPKGHKLISADYSQVELRLMAVVADVPALKEAFAQGIDIHTATAMQVFGLTKDEVTHNIRRHAKAINFGIVYGISQYGLAKQIGVSSDEAKKYIDTYFAKMPQIKTYMEKTILFARKYGYVVTPFGRKCSVLGINDKNGRIVSFAERAAINAPLQGGSADIMKKAMNQMYQNLVDGNFKSKILLQVHDEMVLQVPDDEVEAISKLLKETMENIVNYDVKFIADVGVGNNWAEAH